MLPPQKNTSRIHASSDRRERVKRRPSQSRDSCRYVTNAELVSLESFRSLGEKIDDNTQP